MIVVKFSGGNVISVYGLTQWDYGQELVIECAELEIIDGTEINFYQGKLSSVAYIKNKHVMIPDIMLQCSDEITAYVYVRGEDCGETILSIKLLISVRPQPDNYVLPEYRDYLRLIPAGGTPGQTLAKATEMDYDTEWIDGVGMEAMSDDDVDVIFAG